MLLVIHYLVILIDGTEEHDSFHTFETMDPLSPLTTLTANIHHPAVRTYHILVARQHQVECVCVYQ